jgi:hypothetical protein
MRGDLVYLGVGSFVCIGPYKSLSELIFVLDINLPLIGFAFFAVVIFLRVRTPPGSVKEKLLKVDWL